MAMTARGCMRHWRPLRDDILVEREVYVQLVDDHLGTGDEGAVAM